MVGTSLFTIYRLTLPVGSERVRLYGLLGVENGEAVFALSKDLALPKSLVPPDATSAIVDPLGLTGVTLTGLELAGRVYRKEGKTTLDLAVQASAVFPSIAGLTLTGALVIDEGQARLAVIALSTQRPLTLTEFLGGIAGGYMSWASVVTDQFAFVSGKLYRLEPPPNAGDAYTFSYSLRPDQPAIYKPGYRISGTFLVFGQYAFDVSLQVARPAAGQKAEVVLTASATAFDFDFIAFKAPRLDLRSADKGSRIAVTTDIAVFGTDVGAIEAVYDTGRDAFSGAAVARLGRLSLPAVGETDVTLTVAFQWARADKGGLKITAIGGLPTGGLDIAEKLERVFNQLRSGGCEKILTDWMKGISSSFAPGLNGSPSKRPDCRMTVPLKLAYTLSWNGGTITDAEIGFDAVVTVPSGLDALPGALWSSIVDSLDDIVGDILSDADTYKAVAVAIGAKFGAAAFARFICRALKWLEELAKKIADAAVELATDTIAAVAELAGMLVAVALLGLKGLLNFFEEIIDEIKKLFGGGDSKKDEAEDKIREKRAEVEEAMAGVDRKIAAARQRMKISALSTGLDESGRSVTATISWASGRKPIEDGQEAGRFICRIRFLAGEAGTMNGAVVAQKDVQEASTSVPLTDLAASDYRMNAVVEPAITGIRFMDEETAGRLESAAAELNDLDNGVASDFASYLLARRDEFRGYYDHGLTGAAVYASTDVPSYVTVGRSRIGFNSRLAA